MSPVWRVKKRNSFLENLRRHSIRRKTRADPPILIALLIPLGVLLLGTAGYVFLQGFGWFDAFYMTIITLTTVGFAEVRPLSTVGKLLTSVIIVFGVGSFLYAIGQISEYVVRNAVQGRRRMDKHINRLSDHYIICGYGRSGEVIARRLAGEGAAFVAIDEDHAKIERIAEEGFLFVEGNATEDEVLNRAGVERARGLVAVLPNDADNLYVTLSAKEANPRIFVIARGEAEGTGVKLRRAGADKVVNPYESSGLRMANILLNPSIHAFMEDVLYEAEVDIQIGELEVAEGSKIAETTLEESRIRKDHGSVVVGLRERGGKMVFNPGPARRISSGDVLIVLGPKAELERLERICTGS